MVRSTRKSDVLIFLSFFGALPAVSSSLHVGLYLEVIGFLVHIPALPLAAHINGNSMTSRPLLFVHIVLVTLALS
jgi:hypothetical protein